jgi:hypothetical protein
MQKKEHSRLWEKEMLQKVERNRATSKMAQQTMKGRKKTRYRKEESDTGYNQCEDSRQQTRRKVSGRGYTREDESPKLGRLSSPPEFLHQFSGREE